MTEAESFRADDLTALNNLIASASRFAGSNGAIANPYSGFSTGRDPQSFSQIVPVRDLTLQECLNLYEGDRLVQVLVEAYPMRSPAPVWTFGSQQDGDSKLTSDSITQYLDRAARNGNNYSIKAVSEALSKVSQSDDLYNFLNPESGFMNLFRATAQDSRLFKFSYILIGVDDGYDWEEPLSWESIRSLRWLKQLSQFECTPKDNAVDPEFYEIGAKRNEKKVVHQSRIIRLLGKSIPLTGAQLKSCPSSSVVQPFYPAYSRLVQCLQSATNMVVSHSAFTSGVQGLGEMTKTPEGRQKLSSRLETMMMSLSSLRGIMYDTNGESVNFINRSYAGVKDIIDIQFDYVASQTDLPRFLLFGTSNRTGLGSEGRGEQEMLQFAQSMDSWVSNHLKDPMLYLGTIALLAEDSPSKGRIPRGFGVSYPSIMNLTPTAYAVLMKDYMEGFTKAVDAGFVDKTEVRRSIFQSSSIPLQPVISLDDRISEMMEEALEGAIEGDSEDEEIEDDEEDLEENDRTTEEESEDIEGEAIDPDDEEDRGDSEWDGFRIDGEDSEPDWWRFDEAYGVFFSGRRTGIFVQANSRSQAISKARKRKRRGGTKVVSVRKPTAQERKIASRGGWSRFGPKGEKPGKLRIRGYGPKPKNSRSDSPDIDQRFDVIEKTKSGKFILWNTDRTKVLGTHSSYEEALAQERAIEISKHQKNDESHETIDDSGISEFLSDGDDSDRITLDDLWERYDSKNEPVDKALWQQSVAEAKRKFAVYPSAYGNLYASKVYRSKFRKKHPGQSPWRIKKDAIVVELRSDSVENCLDMLLDEFDVVLDSLEEILEHEDDLREWLRQEWVRISAENGSILGKCGDRDKNEGYPKCLDRARAERMSPQERIAAVRRKRSKVKRNHSGKPIHVSTHGKKDEQDTESRSDALRLTELPQVGSRVKYRGRLYLPNRPYKKGDRLIVLATRGSFVKLVEFGADDVDISNDFNSHQSQFWANLYYSFGQPPIETTEEPETATDDRTDVESIEVSGDILDKSEFDELGAIDLLQTLENIFEEE